MGFWRFGAEVILAFTQDISPGLIDLIRCWLEVILYKKGRNKPHGLLKIALVICMVQYLQRQLFSRQFLSRFQFPL